MMLSSSASVALVEWQARSPCEYILQPTCKCWSLRASYYWATQDVQEALSSPEHGKDAPPFKNIFCTLRKCRVAKDLGYTQLMYKHICNHGLETHVELGNSLVQLFVECGNLSNAEQVFCRLVYRTEHSWTSLIQGYIDLRELRHAFVLFQEMKEDSAHPSVYTYLALLRGCARLGCIVKGHILHTTIVSEALDNNIFIGSTLVDLYAKCGSLLEAQKVLDELLIRDVVSWNALIGGYADKGYSEKALVNWERMQQEGVSPDAVTSACVLKACGTLRAIDQGRELHVNVVKKGIEQVPFIGNTLIHMYTNCGSLIEATNIFDKLHSPDVISWTALIGGYVDHGLPGEALMCLDDMQSKHVSPNAVTFACSLKACGSSRDIDKGLKIHSDIVKEGYEQSLLVGNALIDMFAKCGSLLEAQQVFDELPDQDIVSWNTLITGYTECGWGGGALLCLEEMQIAEASLNEVILISCLKACGLTGDVERGRMLHNEAVINGFEAYPFVGNTLVDMYAKCGLLVESQEVFNTLLFRDTVTWTALMVAYTEQQYANESLNCLRRMQSDGVPLSAATLVCGMKACGIIGAIDKGYELHTQVLERGLEGDVYTRNALVFMYVECKSISEAEKAFHGLPIHDIISWNALMDGYLEHGLAEKALSCFEEMQKQGLLFDTLTYVCGLKACGSMRAVDRVEDIYAEICKEGLEADAFISSALLCAFAKCGALSKVVALFDDLRLRNVILWTALIAGYTEHGLGEEALNCLDQMQVEGVSPDAVTFVYAVKACCDLGAMDRGRSIHSNIAKAGWERDSSIGDALVHMYAKSGNFVDAWNLFDKLLVWDTTSWNALIAGYTEHYSGEEASNFLEMMQQEGACPNNVTFNFILKVCANLGDLERGQEMHAEITIRGFDRGLFLANTLLDMYAKCSLLAEARKVLEGMLVRDVVSWTSLIAGYAEHGLSDEALNCMERMELEGVPSNLISWNALIFAHNNQEDKDEALVVLLQMQEQGVLPDIVTLMNILKVCANAASLKTGKKLHCQTYTAVGVKGLEFTLVTALIDMYSNCGAIVEAQQVFDTMTICDLVRWTSLITAYARLGETESVFYWFENMKEKGIEPNDVTFLSILTACSHAGLVGQGLRFFKDMKEYYAIAPSNKHHNCMLDLLGRAGQLDEAEAVLHKMSCPPDLVTWNTVLGACHKWSNVELAQQAFDNVTSLDGNSDTVFDSMVNIYAGAQQAWKNAERVEVGQAFT